MTTRFPAELDAFLGNLSTPAVLVTAAGISGDVATLITQPHEFVPGQPITVAGMGAPFDGQYTVSSTGAQSISFALSHADIPERSLAGVVEVAVDLNAVLAALEGKVGIDGSDDHNSLDYKVAHGGGGGGGGAGAPVVRKFPFAFNSPGLSTGFAVYIPTVGDILLDAWIEIDTPWNGTTPKGDVGTFTNSFGQGFFINVFDVLDMTIADNDDALDNNSSLPDGFRIGFLPSLAELSATATVRRLLGLNALPPTAQMLSGLLSPVRGIRYAPAQFTAANPIKVVVSQDGTNTGADPGATQGAAVLYLVTATPA